MDNSFKAKQSLHANPSVESNPAKAADGSICKIAHNEQEQMELQP